MYLFTYQGVGGDACGPDAGAVRDALLQALPGLHKDSVRLHTLHAAPQHTKRRGQMVFVMLCVNASFCAALWGIVDPNPQ